MGSDQIEYLGLIGCSRYFLDSKRIYITDSPYCRSLFRYLGVTPELAGLIDLVETNCMELGLLRLFVHLSF